MTRKEAFDEINSIQDEYIDKLLDLMDDQNYAAMKSIDFTSATGTGKSKMMSKLINRRPGYYFIVTTLSKGQLHLQLKNSLKHDCKQKNFYVYGSADYRINSKLDAEDIISRIPKGKPCVWLRDEGHIRTNRFDELLRDVCYKVVNFSATNPHSDIKCNFTSTMMLRTVEQSIGTPEDAILKLLEVKEIHSNVPNYNPCAIFRCVGGDQRLYKNIIDLCKEYDLSYIDISDDEYVMAELCEDDNEYDVIINKFKIVEGIDIRRAHVLYMDNQPSNAATTIQVIGRCRRNALLYRDDIDIFEEKNYQLLQDTRKCYVYYNVKDMKVDSDENGELYYAFCDQISCEALKPNSRISVINGQLMNGLYVMELKGQTGDFDIKVDENTGFNVVSPITKFYDKAIASQSASYLYFQSFEYDENAEIGERWKNKYIKLSVDDVYKFPVKESDGSEYYDITQQVKVYNYSKSVSVSPDALSYFEDKYNDIIKLIKKHANYIPFENILTKIKAVEINIPQIRAELKDFISTYRNKDKSWEKWCEKLLNIGSITVEDISSTSYSLKKLTDFCSCNAITLLQYCLALKAKKEDESVQEHAGDPRYSYADYNPNRWIFIDKIVQSVIIVLSKFKEMQYILDDDTINNIIRFMAQDDKGIRIHTDISDMDQDTFYLCGGPIVESEVIKGSYHIASTAYGDPVKVSTKNISEYLSKWRWWAKDLEGDSVFHHIFIGLSTEEICRYLIDKVQETFNKIHNGIIDCAEIDYRKMFKDVTPEERKKIDDGILEVFREGRIQKQTIKKYIAYAHDTIINDKESAIIGTDMMHLLKTGDGESQWTEMRAVSSKVCSYNKLNQFLSMRYASEIAVGKAQCFTGKNHFSLDKKCNSMIGYCVEYYSKYIVYGSSYLGDYLYDAMKEFGVQEVTDAVIVRACMLKYRAVMVRGFGQGVSKILKTASAQTLVKENYKYFISLIVALGTQTADYVQKTLYSDRPAEDNVDPNLSIRHISGVADYITSDTILDVKVKNCIEEANVRQVLAYHYLSTKRSDLHIKKVIVYDASSNKAVTINIPAGMTDINPNLSNIADDLIMSDGNENDISPKSNETIVVNKPKPKIKQNARQKRHKQQDFEKEREKEVHDFMMLLRSIKHKQDN